MSTFAIEYDGEHITADVVIEDAYFTGRADGNVGEAQFRVLDRRDGPYVPGYFQVGRTVTLEIDGRRVWGGYVSEVSRQYAFAATDTSDPDTHERFWVIRCVDYNILFNKRLVYVKSDPTAQFPIMGLDQDVTDLEAIELILESIDVGLAEGFSMDGARISMEGCTTAGKVVGQVGDDTPCFMGYQVASPGMTWGDAMRKVVEQTGAIFYIAPAMKSGDDEDVGPWLMYHSVNAETNLDYWFTEDMEPVSDPELAREFIVTRDGSQLATEAHVWGAGMGSQGQVTHVEYTDSLVNTYGLFQWSDFSSTMWDEQCLRKRAESYITGLFTPNKRGHAVPVESWTITTYRTDLLVGYLVSLDLASVLGETAIGSDSIPIREMRITFPTEQDARFDLVLSHHVAATWGSSQWWNAPPPGGGEPDPRWWSEFLPFPPYWSVGPGDGAPPVNQEFPIDQRGMNRVIDGVTVEKDYQGSGDFQGAGVYIYYNNAWPFTSCGVGPGSWGPSVRWEQDWYGWSQPAFGVERGGPDPRKDVFVSGQLMERYGTGGKFIISFIADSLASGGWSALRDAQYNVVPGTPIGEIDIEGDIEEDPVANYLGITAGGVRHRDALVIPAGLQEVIYSDDVSNYGAGWWDPPVGFPTGPMNWIVFTPVWDVPNIEVCDIVYTDPTAPIDIAARGPAFQGQHDSGTLITGPMTGTKLDARTFPYSQGEVSEAQTWPGIFMTPFEGPDGSWKTSYPYVPGTLEVYVNGQPLRNGFELWEVEPAKGTFRIRLEVDAVSGDGLRVTYMRASASTVDWDSWSDYYMQDEYPYPIDPDGRVYRPKFVSQLGWGTQYDGINCVPAAACVLLDRHTMGTKRRTPPQMRSLSGDTSGGLTLDQVVDLFRTQFNEHLQNPGSIGWDEFVHRLAEGRGALMTGNSEELVPFDLHARSEYTGAPFTGFHSLYANEIRADGHVYIYDPAFRVNSKYGISPGWYPPAAVRQYAAARSGSVNRVWAIYTQKTPRM